MVPADGAGPSALVPGGTFRTTSRCWFAVQESWGRACATEALDAPVTAWFTNRFRVDFPGFLDEARLACGVRCCGVSIILFLVQEGMPALMNEEQFHAWLDNVVGRLEGKSSV